MNCQTSRPPNNERCEHCWEPRGLAFIACEHPNVPVEKGQSRSRPICGAIYLVQDVVPAPDWCPLRNDNVKVSGISG